MICSRPIIVRWALVAACILLSGASGCDTENWNGPAEPEVRLGPILEGNVFASGGRSALRGATVTIVFHPNAQYMGNSRRTDGAGYYNFGHVRSGVAHQHTARIELRAEAPGYAPQNKSVVVHRAHQCTGGVMVSDGIPTCYYRLNFDLDPR